MRHQVGLSPHLGGGALIRVNSSIHTALTLTMVKYMYVIRKIEEYKSFNFSGICNDS